MVPHFAYAFQGLVVGEYAELGVLKMAAKAFEIPNDAAGLQTKRSPMPFRVERSSADIRDGFGGTVLLLLFEGSAKPIEYTWNGRDPSATSSQLGKAESAESQAPPGFLASIFPYRA